MIERAVQLIFKRKEYLAFVVGMLGALFFFSFKAQAEFSSSKLRYGITIGPSEYRLHDLSYQFYVSDSLKFTPAILFGKSSGGLSNFEFDLTPSYSIDENNRLILDLRFYRDDSDLKSNVAKLTYDFNLSSIWDAENRTYISTSVIGRRDTESGPPSFTTTQSGLGFSILQELTEDWSIGASASFYSIPSTSLSTTTVPTLRRNGNSGKKNGNGGGSDDGGGGNNGGTTQAGEFSPSSGFEKYSQSIFLNGAVFDNTTFGVSYGRYAYYGDEGATWSVSPSVQQDFSENWSAEIAWSYQKAFAGNGANYVTIAALYYFD